MDEVRRALGSRLQRIDVEDVAFDQLEVRMVGQFEPRQRVTMEVVECDNAVLGHQLSGERRADETGPAGDEDSLALERHAPTVTAMKSSEPTVSPPAMRIQTPVFPQRTNTGPATSRPTGAPSPLAVITPVITFARSATGGRVDRIPMIGALTIGTKKPQIATASSATGHATGATITQSGAVASSIAPAILLSIIFGDTQKAA